MQKIQQYVYPTTAVCVMQQILVKKSKLQQKILIEMKQTLGLDVGLIVSFRVQVCCHQLRTQQTVE